MTQVRNNGLLSSVKDDLMESDNRWGKITDTHIKNTHIKKGFFFRVNKDFRDNLLELKKLNNSLHSHGFSCLEEMEELYNLISYTSNILILCYATIKDLIQTRHYIENYKKDNLQKFSQSMLEQIVNLISPYNIKNINNCKNIYKEVNGDHRPKEDLLPASLQYLDTDTNNMNIYLNAIEEENNNNQVQASYINANNIEPYLNKEYELSRQLWRFLDQIRRDCENILNKI